MESGFVFFAMSMILKFVQLFAIGPIAKKLNEFTSWTVIIYIIYSKNVVGNIAVELVDKLIVLTFPSFSPFLPSSSSLQERWLCVCEPRSGVDLAGCHPSSSSGSAGNGLLASGSTGGVSSAYDSSQGSMRFFACMVSNVVHVCVKFVHCYGDKKFHVTPLLRFPRSLPSTFNWLIAYESRTL